MNRQVDYRFHKIPRGKFRMAAKCYSCAGSGLNICPVCNGNKKFNGEECSECGGIGTVKCYACGGRGVLD